MARIRSVLALAVAPALAKQGDFYFYPPNAQACLNQASNASGCRGNNTAKLNACLCSDGGGFVTKTATCLGLRDSGDAEAVYRTMAQACADSSTPLSVTQSDFLAIAAAATADRGRSGTSSATGSGTPGTATELASATAGVTGSSGTASTTELASATAEATDSPEAVSDSSDDGSLPVGAMVGIAVGASVGGVGAVAAASLLLYRRRRRNRRADEALCPPYGQSPAESKLLATDFSPYGSPVQPQPHRPEAFEMDGAGVRPAVEMEGSAPAPRAAAEVEGSEPALK